MQNYTIRPMFNTSRARIIAVLSEAGIVPSSRKTPWRHNYDEVPEHGVWNGDKS